ncbi:tRNA (N6-isopentenyl adenosine(37)-C2)-methylthiotransferase MiaB [Desulfoferrobacter suflitae]|uniref:tRNA (N6-isopentenyl adenosine(37)-C2)-methylthiotransferase MiaB n=1 Tax=Desulfoferrobacter suflitae TaxID=2865782 RepID=UPI0021644285|nr:tRNA (N6-isopentenyl adenosine(37)-C2)-methylthiotransferase MiaB [Desulfoferrobacter suflitae]MCK8602554.1 tRNA (N6-isopentenyl adenosine(37)-C2)-methylthiotransferase MiaB [Desulfoferrobacter suflitae]
MQQPFLKTADPARYLFVQTFGCQMNEYDSLRVQRMLSRRGYLPTSDLHAADVIFLNTCSVREKAEQKVHSFLGRLRRVKARNPQVRIIVAGCVAQQLGKKLLERFDYVDVVLGTGGIDSVGELLEQVQDDHCRITHLPDRQEDENWRALFQQLPSIQSEIVAPVTIMQGCNNFCTYCIVPHVRGRERSRRPNEIIREIQLLAAGGAREILLLGQNVNSYGKGLAEKTSFVDLLHRIGSETDIDRVRFTTSHPKDLSDALVACLAQLPILCKYLHLPVQAGSDRILQRMNRGYSADRYRERIDRLRQCCPEMGLSSDVMVGFPGETEEDFDETMRLLNDIQFDNLFSFAYSDRPYAASSHFPDKVSREVKARRLTELQSLQATITLNKNQAEVGSVREVLVEGPSRNGEGQITGRTQQNRIVNFTGPRHLLGKIVRTKITAAFSHSLKGELLSKGS